MKSPNGSTAKKLDTPSCTTFVDSDKELRFELPFHHKFDNLTYIGIVTRETWNMPAHFHEHFELCYIAEGRGWFAIDGFLYEVSQGDLFVTKPGEIHYGAATGELPFCLYYFGFQLEQIRNLVEYYQLGIHRVTQDKGNIVKNMCDKIIEEITFYESDSSSMVQGIFLQTLVYVARIYRRSSLLSDNGPTALTPTIKEILTYIHENISFNHNILEIAEKFHISRTHLEREFKRCLGVPLGQYIRSICIDRAKYYLKETTESITSISETLHFDSISKFSMFFKRSTGIYPKHFREMTKKLKN